MRIFLVAMALLLATSFTGIAQDSATHRDYKRFHTGTFEYLTGTYRGSIIKRTRRRQYEYDPAVHTKAVLRVKWISDDEFWLTLLKDRNKSRGNKNKGMVIKVKIVSATKDSYVCHWTCDKCGNGQNDSFRKIK